MTDEKLVNFKADEKLHNAAKQNAEHGELSQRFREVLKELAYGAAATERERVQERLTSLRDQRRDVDADIQRLKSKRDELDRKIERAERKLNELQELDGKYDGMLETIESQLHDGVRFPPGGPPIQKAAGIIDATADDVIADLKERNPDVPDAAFRPARDDEPPQWNKHTTNTLHSIGKDKDKSKDKDGVEEEA